MKVKNRRRKQKKSSYAMRLAVPLLSMMMCIMVSCGTAPSEKEKIDAPSIDKTMKREAEKEQIEEKKEEESVAEQAEEKIPDKELSEEEEARLTRLVDELSYLVYPESEAETTYPVDALAAKAANTFLSENGIEYVEFAQVDKLIKERFSVYRKETNEAVSPPRWSAYKFNTDIYVRTKVGVNTEEASEAYYATAAVSLLFYYKKNGAKWAEVKTESEKAYMSTESERQAVETAIQETVRRAIKQGVNKTKTNAVDELKKGIPFTLEVRNTKEEELIHNFIKSFESRVESLEEREFSSEKAVYRVRYIGEVTELEEEVFRTAENYEGLNDLFLVYQRGYTLIFNTGM